MSFQNYSQIMKIFTITKLTEHHCKQLDPTSKMLNIAIVCIIICKPYELIIIQNFYYLSENVFILIHLKSYLLTSKLLFQIVVHRK